MGANRTSGLGMITALSLLEQDFRDLISPIAFVCAVGSTNITESGSVRMVDSHHLDRDARDV